MKRCIALALLLCGLAPVAMAAEAAFKAGCGQDICTWYRINDRQFVIYHPHNTLIKLRVTIGRTENDARHIRWSGRFDAYANCSITLPAIITRSATIGKWTARELTPGSPNVIRPGDIPFHALYLRACHFIENPTARVSGEIEKFGYPSDITTPPVPIELDGPAGLVPGFD